MRLMVIDSIGEHLPGALWEVGWFTLMQDWPHWKTVSMLVNATILGVAIAKRRLAENAHRVDKTIRARERSFNPAPRRSPRRSWQQAGASRRARERSAPREAMVRVLWA